MVELTMFLSSFKCTHPDISLNPQLFLFGFKHFHVFTYPYSNRICPSIRIRHVSGFTLVPITPLGILATEHAS